MKNWLKKIHNSVRSPRRTPPAQQYALHDDDIELGQALIPLASNTPAISEPSISAWQITRSLAALMLAKDNLPGILSAAVLTGLGTGMNFVSPYLFGETINLLTNNDQETSEIVGVELNRSMLIALLITAYSLAQAIPNIRDQIMVPVTNRNVKKIIVRSTEHLLQRSLNYHVNTPLPTQIYLMQKGFSVSTIGTPLLTQVGPTLVEIAIACTVLSSSYGFETGLGLLGLMLLYTAYSAATAKLIINAREDSLKVGNQAWDYFLGALAQYKTMQDFGKFNYTMAKVSDAMDKMITADITASLRPLQIGLGHIAIARIAMLGAILYVGLGVQSRKFTTQEFVVLFGYLNQLASLLPSFGAAVNQVFAAYPDLKFVLGALAKPSEVIDLHPDTPLMLASDKPPSIEFKDVSFSYPPKPGEQEEAPLFQNLSFKVNNGQKVAFVSESGAGKTTIFNLLYGFYAPSAGSIFIDGQDISKMSLHSVQSHITLFGQTPNLFKGTIRENIVYGAPDPDHVTDEMIWELARRANLYDFLQAFTKKLDTDVGEAGKQLSGGQQQKVAILRALFKQGPIRLLDEITAPCDSQSATQVMQGIDSTSEGTTSLMITHKLTEAQFVDQIFVIDKGKVIAQGTHKELLASCTLYKKLWAAYTKPEAQTSASSTQKMLSALGGAGVSSVPDLVPSVSIAKSTPTAPNLDTEETLSFKM